MWLAFGLALLFADPDLVIRSSTSCPDAVAVMRELQPLLPAGASVVAGGEDEGSAEGRDRADLSVDARTRWLRVRTGAGRVSRARALPASLTCDEAARAAAVLLAAWQFQGSVEVPPVDRPPVTAPPQVQPSASSDVVPSPPARLTLLRSAPARAASTDGAGSGHAPAPSEPRAATAAATAASARPAPETSRRFAIGAGFAAGRGASQFPLIAMAEALLGKREGLGFHAQATLSSRYSLALAPGHARWTRSSIGVGGTFTGRTGSWGGQGRVDLVGALLSISGEGFGVNEDSRQFALGGTVGARVIRTLGSADLWLDLACTAWPGKNQVMLRDAPSSLELSTFDAFLGLGADFFVWP